MCNGIVWIQFNGFAKLGKRTGVIVLAAQYDTQKHVRTRSTRIRLQYSAKLRRSRR